jgi:hypothetical protein
MQKSPMYSNLSALVLEIAQLVNRKLILDFGASEIGKMPNIEIEIKSTFLGCELLVSLEIDKQKFKHQLEIDDDDLFKAQQNIALAAQHAAKFVEGLKQFIEQSTNANP